jgi:hypothetical protein
MNLFTRIFRRVKPEPVPVREPRDSLASIRRDTQAELYRVGQWGNQIVARVAALEAKLIAVEDLRTRVEAMELERNLASTPTSSRNGNRVNQLPSPSNFGNRVKL